MKYTIEDAKDIQPEDRKSPYAMFIENVKSQGKFWTYPEVCKMLNVSKPTLQKAVKGKGVPSKGTKFGRRHVWLFTEDDVLIAAGTVKVDEEEIKWV